MDRVRHLGARLWSVPGQGWGWGAGLCLGHSLGSPLEAGLRVPARSGQGRWKPLKGQVSEADGEAALGDQEGAAVGESSGKMQEALDGDGPREEEEEGPHLDPSLSSPCGPPRSLSGGLWGGSGLLSSQWESPMGQGSFNAH